MIFKIMSEPVQNRVKEIVVSDILDIGNKSMILTIHIVYGKVGLRLAKPARAQVGRLIKALYRICG